MAYNKEQWIASFEGQLAILRPHLTERVLAAIGQTAWSQHGRREVDPIEAARTESAAMDKPAAARPPRSR